MDLGPVRRSRGGWVLLWSLFGLLVAVALMGNAERASDPTAEIFQIETELQSAMALKSAGPVASGIDVTRDRIVAVKDKLEPMLDLGPRAARLYAIACREIVEKPNPSKIRELQYSLKPYDQLIYLAYTQKWSAAEMKALADQIPDVRGGERLAKVQLLEASGDTQARKKYLQGAMVGQLIFAATFILALAAGVAMWIAYAVYKPKPKGFPGGIVTRFDADLAAWRVCMLLGAYIVVGLVPESLTMLKIPVFFLMLGLGLTMPIQRVPFRLGTVMGETKPKGKLMLYGIATEFAAVPLILATLAVAIFLQRYFPNDQHPGATEVMANPTAATIVIFFIQAVVVAPIVEEIMFRGLLAPAIARFSTPVIAIVLSSLLFAAIHPQGVAAWLSLATVGGMAAVVAYHTRSLVPSMVMHALHNGGLLAMLLMTTR